MTENEAVEALRLINTSRVHPFYSWEEMAEVRDIAISALKEIQQYREIGTVKECKEMASIVKKSERSELAKIIDEWLKYRKIGTVEECGEAVEKQKPMQINIGAQNFYKCHKCQSVLRRTDKYCHECGQSIKWDENLE